MGVGDYFINGLLNGKTLFSKLHIWSFKSNFDYVLLTQDGSDVEGFRKKFLINSKNSSIIFNGVKKIKQRLIILTKLKVSIKIKLKYYLFLDLKKVKIARYLLKVF